MMTPEEYAELQERYLELHQLPSEERAQRLREFARDNPYLSDELSKLLGNDGTDFLETPIASFESAKSLVDDFERETDSFHLGGDHESPDDDGPEKIGPYRILQKIGTGGHGVVYMAEQTSPIRRRVALKRIKPGMQSKEILARFEAERQALALMKHPSIANVLDAGTGEDGRPYFVMELVRGLPIDEFCRRNSLSLAATLELILQVCDAVHHAHRKGIIHRDLKPANILVTLDSGKPLAKVIDFGIAKALHLSLTDQTMFTQFGQIIGTLEYMSPEQATMSQELPDVRSDVYSLGVILYVLLTGQPPITKQQLLERGLLEMANAFESYRPATPSLRFSQSNAARDWKHFSDADRRAWTNRLKGDLDWITMKALDRDPRLRYDSTAALASDIENFLSGLPVVARPHSLGYRVTKWIRRHRVAAFLMAAFALSLVVCLSTVTWAYITTRDSLADVRKAEALAGQKAEALRQSLDETERQRRRADANAKRLSKRLKREILSSAWNLSVGGDKEGAREQLLTLPIEERGFAWHFVDQVREHIAAPAMRNGRKNPIRATRLHPGSGKLALVTTDSILELWDVRQREMVRSHRLPPRLYSCLEFNDGANHVLLGAPNWCGLMNLETGKLASTITHNRGGTRDIAHDHTRELWLVSTGSNHLLSIGGDDLTVDHESRHSERLTQVAVAPDGSWSAVATNSGSVLLFDGEKPDQFSEVAVSSHAVADLRWTDGALVLVDQLGTYFTINVHGEPPPVAKRLASPANETNTPASTFSCLCLGTADQVFAATRSGEVKLVLDGEQSVSLRRFGRAVVHLECDWESGNLLVHHFDGSINHISATEIEHTVALATAVTNVTDGLALDSNQGFVSAHADGQIRVWRSNTARASYSENVHEESILSIDANSHSGQIASFGQDWMVRVSQRDSLRTQWSKSGTFGVRVLKFSHDGELLAGPPERTAEGTPSEGTIDLWLTRDGSQSQRLLGHENWVMQVEFSADDSQLFSYALDGTFRQWDVTSGDCIGEIDLSSESPITCFCILESQSAAVFGHDDGSVSRWNLNTGSIEQRAYVLSSAANQVISATGSEALLVSAVDSSDISILSAQTLEATVTLDAAVGPIRGMRTDSRTERILVLGDSGATKIWPLPNSHLSRANPSSP